MDQQLFMLQVTEMKEFMALVLKIAFNNLYFDKQIP